MKEVIIIYFSGTGNTELVTSLISDNLKSSGVQVEAICCEEIEKIQSIHFNDKVLVLGFPVYLFRAPMVIDNAINALLMKCKTVPTCVFSTKAWASGNSIRVVAEKLRQIGFITANTESFICPSNGWITLLDKNNLLYKLTRFEKNLDKKVKRFSDGIKGVCLSDDKPKQKFLPNNVLLELGRIVGKKIEDELFADLCIDCDKCINCKKCVNKCPVKKFDFIDNKVVINDSVKCIQCLRCISSCPVQCIDFGQKTLGKKRYDKKTMMEYYNKIKSHE